MKTCTKCYVDKSKEEFTRQKETKDGLRGQCKVCRAVVTAKWAKDNPEKVALHGLKWRQANLERLATYKLQWQKENKDKVAISCAKYHKENKEKCIARIAEWRKANPEKDSIYKHTRRARKHGSGGKLSAGLFDKLFKLQRGKCPVCRGALSNIKPRSPLDHVIALVNGGTNQDWNMQILCKSCNSQKYAKDNIEFMQSRGFLL